MNDSIRDAFTRGITAADRELDKDREDAEALAQKAAGLDQVLRNSVRGLYEEVVATAKKEFGAAFTIMTIEGKNGQLKGLAVETTAHPKLIAGSSEKVTCHFVVEIDPHHTSYQTRGTIFGSQYADCETTKTLPATVSDIQTQLKNWVTAFARAWRMAEAPSRS
jgi:hypothetical protein